MEWTWLGKRTSSALLNELPRVFGVDIVALVQSAALKMQTQGGRMALRARSDTGSLVYAEPRQNLDGSPRADASAILTRDALDRPPDVQEAVDMDFEQLMATGDLEVSRQNLLQLQLWGHPNPLPIITAHLDKGNRFFRIGAHRSLYGRVRLFEILAELQSGVPVEDLQIGFRAKLNPLVSGIWQLYPGSLMCFPMTTRHQPLAMLYITPLGSQIAMLPPKGMVFKRTIQLFGWPVGTVGQTLEGPGKGIYRNAGKLWEGDGAREILDACVQGADGLLQWVSDPGRWGDADGYFHVDELWLAWASLSQGATALAALGETWNGSSSLWDAFRALGILQGVWAGSDERSVKLSDFLRPDHLRTYAASQIPNDRLRNWSLRVLDNWEEHLHSGFPGKSIGEAVAVVADVRNIVHGVGATGPKRTRRLVALREMADAKPSLQLIADLAVMWRSAAMFSPGKVYRAGQPPWVSP